MIPLLNLPLLSDSSEPFISCWTLILMRSLMYLSCWDLDCSALRYISFAGLTSALSVHASSNSFSPCIILVSGPRGKWRFSFPQTSISKTPMWLSVCHVLQPEPSTMARGRLCADWRESNAPPWMNTVGESHSSG